MARTGRTVSSDITVMSVDLTSALDMEETISNILESFLESYGIPSIIVHNSAILVIAPFEETSIEDFGETWRSMTLSAPLLATYTLPVMATGKGGAFLVSGATASLRGGAKFSAFASAKFALRGLIQSLAREYSSQGKHLAHIILDGIVDTDASRALHIMKPSRMMKTEEIANLYWQLAHQPKSTWTHELDLRPMTENF